MANEHSPNYLKSLECPICFNYFDIPIYQCPTGHSVCRQCRDKMTRCPSCATKFDRTRNYTLEDVVKNTMVPCSNQCPAEVPLHKLNDHVRNCPYTGQYLDCQVYNCGWHGSLSLLTDHLEVSHASLIVDETDFLKSHQYRMAIIKCEEHFFWLKRFFNEEDDEVTWLAQTVTPLKDHERFLLTIQIHAADGTIHGVQSAVHTDHNDDIDDLEMKNFTYAIKSRTKRAEFKVFICKVA